MQQGAEIVGEEQEQQQEEDMVGVVEGIEMQGEQQEHEEEFELTGDEEELDELAIEEPQEKEDGIDNPEDEDYSCDPDDEDDEDPRPAKQRKLHLAQYNISQPYRSPSATQKLPTCEVLTLPESYVPQMSRSPSVSTESLPIAEYQEWSFQGFFKRTIIEDEITYNLEFKLPHILEHTNNPSSSNLLSIDLSKEIFTEALSPRTNAAHSKMRPPISHTKSKRIP